MTAYYNMVEASQGVSEAFLHPLMTYYDAVKACHDVIKASHNVIEASHDVSQAFCYQGRPQTSLL